MPSLYTYGERDRIAELDAENKKEIARLVRTLPTDHTHEALEKMHAINKEYIEKYCKHGSGRGTRLVNKAIEIILKK